MLSYPVIPTKIPVEAYFPDCVLPSCQQFRDGVVHQHILPKQQQILDTSAKYFYTQGGVGSGKTVGIAAAVVKLSVEIPRNRGVVSRYNFDDLFDSSWKAVCECLERLVEREYISQPSYSKKTQGEYTEIRLHNDSIIKAVQGKNWRRGLGADHGWFWVDDAMECLEEFFIGTETSAGLLSRLRLPHVHFDLSTYHESQREHGNLHGFVSSNPPPIHHWLHQLFGARPGVHRIGDDLVEWVIGETTDNPFTGVGYAKGLIAAQVQMGRDKNVVQRVIFGKSIPAYGGVKVFPQFQHGKHIGTFEFDKALPVVTGWDFGFHHPAVVFNQLYKCKHNTNHLISLSEIADAFSLTVYDLHKYHFKPHVDARYKEASLLLNAGDRAGYRASSSNRDRRGDMKILKDEYNMPFVFRFLELANSLQYCRGLLEPKKPCQCGMEIVQIDQKGCPVLIAALEGGYKYSKSRDGKVSEKPVEDRYFADIACAWRYAAENFVKWGIPWEYQAQVPKPKSVVIPKEPWGWMELSDREFGELLTR